MPNRKTLFRLLLAPACAAVILWLGVGCGEKIDPDYPCGQEALRHAVHVREVRGEIRPLFARLPNESRGRMMEHFFRDVEGNWSDEYGIVLFLGEKFNRETQPPENRIPDEFDGVPVYLSAGTSDYSGGLKVQYERIPEFHYADAVMLKHDDLLMRYPNRAHLPFRGILGDGGRPGEPLSVRIRIFVTEKVDQNTLPPEDRIPDCLDGIPVTIHVIEPDSG